MNNKTLQWLLALSCFFLFVPWKGRKYFPEVLGHYSVQLSASIFSALLASLGLFLSYKYFFSEPNSRKKYFVTCCGFLFVFAIQNLLPLSSAFMVSRIRDPLIESSRSDRIHAKILERTYSNETNNEKSQKLARFYFRITGTIIPARTDAGYELIVPNDEDISKWQENREQDISIEHNLKKLDAMLRQIPFFVAVNFLILFMVFLIGTIFLGFKTKITANKEAQ